MRFNCFNRNRSCHIYQQMDPVTDTEKQTWFRYITVEPTIFFYMFAFQSTSVIEQQLFVTKACLVNHNLTAEICDNLSSYKDVQKEVQVCHACQVFISILIYINKIS